MTRRWAAPQIAEDAVALLAGFDTVYWSSPARVSAAVRGRLDEDKAQAQVAAKAGGLHCPSWLGARVLPTGARGYSFLIETEDWTVKIAGEHMTTWPGIYCELRSHVLHTHEGGERGAIEASLRWVREHLLFDQPEGDVRALCTFETVTPSRVDVHVDWQGGFAPTFDAGEVERFIKPRRVKWHPYFEGNRCTGYRFGEGGAIVARLYNKSLHARERHDTAYPALLAARSPDQFDPERDVWRLEFQLRREALTDFRPLAPISDAAGEDDATDDDPASLEAEIEAELAAEELPHIGTLPKLFAHREALWRHLTTHWLRLVQPGKGVVRSRWALDPTWTVLQRDFVRLSDAPLEADGRELVRIFRYDGRQQLLQRMALGVVKALEVEDASVASAALRELQHLAERIAAQEAAHLEARKAEAAAHTDTISRWVARGMGAGSERPERVRHLIQMLLGIFAAQGVLPLEFKPAYSVTELLDQHLDALDREAERKGGIQQVLGNHFSRVYRQALPWKLLAVPR
jgi:hypothetical protein